VQEVWLIEPEARTLAVHSSAGVQVLSEGAFLTSSFIPGWQLRIAGLFENL
jgi:Uma2 family endonuclease